MRKTMVCGFMFLFPVAACLAADWPQAGGNPQRTGCSSGLPPPQRQYNEYRYYAADWVADFRPEQIYSAQPVIADGRLFQTTLRGNLYALDEETGERLWHFKAGQTIWSGAAAGTKKWGGAGMVFVAAWEGYIYGLDAATGEELWRYDAAERISGSPCIAGDTLFIGTRSGRALALSTGDGALRWETRLSWHIYSSLAWDAGRVYAVTEDMYVHCLDAKGGDLIWTSEKMRGMLMREFYPVIHGDKVLVAVTPSEWQSDPGGPAPFVMDWGGWGMSAEQAKAAWEKYAPALKRGEMPEELEDLQSQIVEMYRQRRGWQSLYVLKAEDGEEAFIPVHHYGAGGLENTIGPPVALAGGRAMVMCVYGGGVRPAVLDLRKNRLIYMLVEHGSLPTDNVQYVSAGGNLCVVKAWFPHIQTSGYVFDLAAREKFGLQSAMCLPICVSVEPDVYAPEIAFSTRRLGGHGGWGVGGPAPAPISGGRIFWINQNPNQIIAYK